MTTSERTYTTTPKRAILSLIVGALVGGPLSIVITVAPSILSQGTGGFTIPELAYQLAVGAVAATVVFAMGLTALAAPAWFLLHRLGHRSWQSAALLGAALAFATSMFLSAGLPSLPHQPGSYSSYGGSEGLLVDRNVVTALGWRTYLALSALLALVCALVGALIWRIAYRRTA